FINDNSRYGRVRIMHRWKGGDYATRNNVIKSGSTVVTGHLHSAHVDPWTDDNGTRWGVDTGCATHPFGAQFNYMEDQPRNWRQGFAVLTFHKGRLLQPELVLAFDDNHVEFRGEVIMIEGGAAPTGDNGQLRDASQSAAVEESDEDIFQHERRRWRKSKRRPRRERKR